MNDFLNNLISGESIDPPLECLPAFSLNFPNAVKADWHQAGEFYEAIFYRENLEHIALFDREGALTEYRAYLPDGYLPEAIRTMLEDRGEIMNAVLRNKGNMIEYEIILRDKDLIRYLVRVSGTGRILDEKKL